MMIARDFGPALASVIHLFRPIIHFAPNRPLQDRGIDERRGWMGMRGIRATRLVFDQHAFHTLAGHIRQGAIKDQRDLGLLSTYQYGRHVIGCSCAYGESCEGNSAEESSEHLCSPSLRQIHRMTPSSRPT